MGQGISIVVPVGPNPKYLEFLDECLQSIREQMIPGDQIIIVSDMSQIDEKYDNDGDQTIYHTPWYVGCATAWNFGVSYSGNDNCILMGSDDRILPGCLEACRETINNKDYDPYGYYNLTCQLSTGELMDLHNNAAMVTRALWCATKGFALESGIGAPDALLISCLIKKASQHLHQIKQGIPLYWVRMWDEQETRRTGMYYEEIISIRNKVTERFQWQEKDCP